MCQHNVFRWAAVTLNQSDFSNGGLKLCFMHDVFWGDSESQKDIGDH